MPSFEEVGTAYAELLGRSLTEPEFESWAGNDNFRAEIAGSPEAQAFRARTGAPAPPGTSLIALPGVPEGYDATRWRDPAVQSDKYVFGRAFAAGTSIQASAALIGATAISADAIRLRNGAVIDVIRDFGGANVQQWLIVGEPVGAEAPVIWSSPGQSVRERILDETAGPTESSPALAAAQRARNFRASVSTGASGGGATRVAAGLGTYPEQTLAAAATAQPRKGNRFTRGILGALTKPIRVANAGVKRVPGTRAVGRWAQRNPKIVTALGIAGSFFIPGVGAAVAAGLKAAGPAIAKGAVALVASRSARSAIAARTGIAGDVGITPLEKFPGPGGRLAAAGGLISQAFEGFLSARQRITTARTQPAMSNVVYTVQDFLDAGQVPDPPFLLDIAGQVTVRVVDAMLDETDGMLWFLTDQNEEFSALDVLELELAIEREYTGAA